ncbi:MAG: NUDIX hydrolase [Acidobacteria bacterium]|jgi:8-oxo-dGTP pyrophosphatase MutT (NUDIX family)|nr:MAG: NUDIX hydrolase [Acidobacteriota bacterium]GIU81671.1 MAG: NUDIX hydrolase [Pyrinomonadaceae bacterium]
MVKIWKREKSRLLADCKVFKVREDSVRSDGKEIKVYVIENPDWVNIIALTDKQEVVLIEQFRYGTEEVILEIPGGMIDEGETAEDAARRELSEETGFSAEKWILLGESNPNPAIQNNKLYHFLALNASKTGNVNFDENESVTTTLVKLEEISELIQSGRIKHSLVVAAFHYFSLWQSRNLQTEIPDL